MVSFVQLTSVDELKTLLQGLAGDELGQCDYCVLLVDAIVVFSLVVKKDRSVNEASIIKFELLPRLSVCFGRQDG